MAKVFSDLIEKGILTIEDVPETLREDVEKLLNYQEVNYGRIKRN